MYIFEILKFYRSRLDKKTARPGLQPMNFIATTVRRQNNQW